MREFYNKLLYMNKIIYILWFQGFENSPEVVKQCVKSWKYFLYLFNNQYFIIKEKYVRFSFLELCVLEPIS
jgi:hypothetical protein